MKRDTSLPLYAPVHILEHSIPLVTYRLNEWPISSTKKQIRTFEYCIHWNINIQKKKFFKHCGSSINQKTNGAISVMLCMGVTFVKKNPCLVARIVSFYAIGLHPRTFLVLEPLSSKRILALMVLLYCYSAIWINTSKFLSC